MISKVIAPSAHILLQMCYVVIFKKLTDDIGSNKMRFLLDESNDISIIKLLGVSIIYNSHASNNIESTYLGLALLEKLALTATEPGSASRSSEVRKIPKYEGLCDRYFFQAIAIETSCVFGRDTNAFISRLGHLTTSISGERREAKFLRQRLSLATVRGNAQSVTQAGRPSS